MTQDSFNMNLLDDCTKFTDFIYLLGAFNKYFLILK